LPRRLAQLGNLMVHASRARTPTGAVLFLGQSGWGKSTLAGLLHRHGFTALCDDCVLLELREGQVWATPAYPGLRLYEDSINQVFSGPPSLAPVADYSSKQRVITLPVPAELLEPHKLLAIHLLGDPQQADDAMSIEPLTPAAACIAPGEHAFKPNPNAHGEKSFKRVPPARGQAINHLGQAAAFTQTTPAFALRYPHDFARQESLLHMLREHLGCIAQCHA